MNILTPISTLWESDENIESIKKHSDYFEGRPPNGFKNYTEVNDKVLAFHCDVIQPIHELTQKDFDYIQSVINHYPNLKLISFHCAYRSKKCFKYKGIGYIEGYCYSEDEMKTNMRNNISQIKQIVGNIDILIENNNYYPTKAYDIVTDAKFISDIVYENDIWFLFDQAHAEISSHNLKINYIDYINNLPLDRCKQIHLCKMGYNDSIYSKDFHLAEDYHFALDQAEVTQLSNIINKCPLVEYLTVEYYKDIEGLLNSINLIKDI